MVFHTEYLSPLGVITLTSDGDALTGLQFRDGGLPSYQDEDLPLFRLTKKWLDLYFSGQQPDFTPPVVLTGTDHQKKVWSALSAIPYGKTITYGDLARQLGTSARAVGSAVSRNPVLLVIPCHRVVGAGDVLTGYAGGEDRKKALLALEK